jgi:cytochrome c-type biogenesis protein CcmH
MTLRLLLICAVAVLLLSFGPPARAAAQVDIYQFPDSQTELRYRGLIDEFRCPKCLNTNLAGSDAPIARDLRRTVHRLVVAEGFSDDQVRDFLQERYGDFVLYSPPFQPGTWILWLAPLGFVLFGAIILLRTVRYQGAVPLNESEQRQIAAIVGTADAGAHTEDADVNAEDADVNAEDAGPQMEFDR